MLLSHSFGTIQWSHYYSKVLSTEAAEVTVQLRNKCAALCWQWESHTREKLYVTHVTSVTQYYTLHTKYQFSSMFIDWEFHSNKNPNTNSWTVNFPHPVFHISRPLILIKFLQLTKPFVAIVWQIRLSTILVLLIVGNWNQGCLQKYDVIYCDNRSAGSTYEANRHTRTER